MVKAWQERIVQKTSVFLNNPNNNNWLSSQIKTLGTNPLLAKNASHTKIMDYSSVGFDPLLLPSHYYFLVPLMMDM